MRTKRKVIPRITAAVLALQVLASPAYSSVLAADTSATVKLRIMETTDLHVNMVNYDYYADKEVHDYGFAKTASLIKAARAESANSLLFDNGDLIQGNPLGDYVAKIDPLQEGEVHPVYKAMNLLDYDLGNIGNHEFNYGLDFLKRSLAGASFEYINANIYHDDHDSDETNDVNYFTPYQILHKEVTDDAGQKHVVKVGVIGFAPPQVLQWDKAHLEGKVIAKDMVQTAKKFIPQMKAEGADLIIAIPHSGFEDIPETELMENSVLYLSKVEGIDAILFGHAHKVFPSKSFEGKTGVNLEKGTINGVASVEPGFWGDHLGIIDLELQLTDGKWVVTNSKTEARPIYDTVNKQPLVNADPAVIEAVHEDHEHTLEYVRGPVGTTTAPINSFFALVQDDPSIQIVTNAQKWYVEKQLQGTEYEGLPVLSAGAPFKAGGRQGPTYYTNIPAGTIAIKNVADLYIYPNTVHAVWLTGAEVKEWLEWSAGQFNQITPGSSPEQALINPDFPTYNYDVIDGVTYQIDVTEPRKYDDGGKLLNPQANRIKQLQYQGKPVDPQQKFIVATNNYRASFTKLANPDGKRIIMAAPDENRQAVIDYIREFKTINPSADQNWSLAPMKGNAKVTFMTSPDAKAFVGSSGRITFAALTKEGYGKYTIDLSSGTDSKQAAGGQNALGSHGSSAASASASEAPPSAGSASASSAGQEKVYIVKKGDNLYRIGLKHGIPWSELAKHNKLSNPQLLHIGQRLLIPSK